jgi:hypothetical protein
MQPQLAIFIAPGVASRQDTRHKLGVWLFSTKEKRCGSGKPQRNGLVQERSNVAV